MSMKATMPKKKKLKNLKNRINTLYKLLETRARTETTEAYKKSQLWPREFHRAERKGNTDSSSNSSKKKLE